MKIDYDNFQEIQSRPATEQQKEGFTRNTKGEHEGAHNGEN